MNKSLASSTKVITGPGRDDDYHILATPFCWNDYSTHPDINQDKPKRNTISQSN